MPRYSSTELHNYVGQTSKRLNGSLNSSRIHRAVCKVEDMEEVGAVV